MSGLPLFGPDFETPLPPEHPDFRFEVLGPEHNASDLDAWSTSIEHLRHTPGFPLHGGWPERAFTLEENLADLVQHRDHHERHLDFAWTVLDPRNPGTVIGCVYLKPDPAGQSAGEARCWVRADHARLDPLLRAHLRPWWQAAWPIIVHEV